MTISDPACFVLSKSIEAFFRAKNRVYSSGCSLVHFIEQQSALASQILEQSQKLCEFEALTFMPDDKKHEYQDLKENLQKSIETLKSFFIKNNVDDLQNLTSKDWRILLGVACTFREWCMDIGFFDLNSSQQEKALLESPLVSFCGLI